MLLCVFIAPRIDLQQSRDKIDDIHELLFSIGSRSRYTRSNNNNNYDDDGDDDDLDDIVFPLPTQEGNFFFYIYIIFNYVHLSFFNNYRYLAGPHQEAYRP
jgi:hypothetical protein